MVASSSGDCPHLVTTPTRFSGQFKCDSKCPMFSTYKLCSHTTAVAEVTGKLKEFTQWLIKQRCAPNYNKLALHGLPKGAGKKGGGTQRRKTTKRKADVTTKTIVDRLALPTNRTHCVLQKISMRMVDPPLCELQPSDQFKTVGQLH